MNERERVIIAGAGPVGLSAAIYLASRGLPVTVLEAGPQLGRDLRASTFHPPTLDMLDEYGITEQVIAQGLVAATWQIRDRFAGVVGGGDRRCNVSGHAQGRLPKAIHPRLNSKLQ